MSVSLTTTAQGPTIEDMQFKYFTARCSCGWQYRTTELGRRPDVESLGEQHESVCVG